VILALLVANQGHIFLLLYRWDTRVPLHRFKPMRCSGQRLHVDDGFPLLLIPCVSSRSFLLVTESCLVVYDHVTASQANTTRYSFKASNDANLDGSSRAKRWTQWARPKRHLQHRQMHDDIFLVREDGVIETCLIDFSDKKVKVTTSITPGSLDICVDSAFCLLEAPAHTGGGDIIIAGGDMTDGGLFQARARQHLERIQTLSNGAPFQDLISVTSKRKSVGNTADTNIFACCGNVGNRGTVVQIHHGLEAQVGWTLEHPDAASIERLWTLEVRSQEAMLLLSSHHSHTSMLVLGLQEMDLEFADSISCPGLDFNQITLAAAMLRNDLLIQITPTTLNIIPIVDQSKAGRMDISDLQAVCADISSEAGWAALGHPFNQRYGLSLCNFNQNTEGRNGASGIMQVAELRTRPLCVQFAKLSGMTALLVGTEQGELYVFAMEVGIGVAQILRVNIQDLVPAIDGVAVSSICLLTHPANGVGLILCGLRGGCLVCVEVRPRDDVEQTRLGKVYLFRIGGPVTDLRSLEACRSLFSRIDNGHGFSRQLLEVQRYWGLCFCSMPVRHQEN
jgi:Mono-functional DNA-alkylating methyl methanesulfonate N-term